jgi:hypothetical protein
MWLLPVQRNPAPQAQIDKFRSHINLLAHILRHLACHPEALDARGPIFDPLERTVGGTAPIVHCLLSLTTAPHKFPDSLQDTLLAVLGQLLIGFPDLGEENAARVGAPTFINVCHVWTLVLMSDMELLCIGAKMDSSP